jgi:AraC-like DNA-binding protein
VLAAEFPFAAPPHAGAYAVLFSGPTRFDAHQAAVRFDARYLALPVTRDEAAMHQMLQRALPLIVRQYRRDRLLVQRVRQLLAAAPRPRTRRHAGRAAACVDAACTASSGRRRSLQALKDEVRKRRATELLLRTPPPSSGGPGLGFANEKSFIRAFRGWTGQSPADFRRQARGSSVERADKG